MPHGLQVWDSEGNVVLDSTTFVMRVVTEIATGTSDGSQAVTIPANTTPIVQVIGDDATVQASLAGSTVSWKFENTLPGDRIGGTVRLLVV